MAHWRKSFWFALVVFAAPVCCLLRLPSSRAPPETDLDALWDGLDVAVPDTEALDTSLPNSRTNHTHHTSMANAKSVRDQSHLQGIVIAGMYDTGTNLLTATLKRNFGSARFRQLCPINHDGSGHCFFNKHFAPQLLDKALSELDRPVLVIAMVRSPLSSITSWKKAPYGLHNCIYSTDFSNDQATFCQVEGGSFQGVSGVWNAYTSNYDSLAAKQRRHKVMVVEYEELVLEPGRVISQISDALNVELISSSVQIIEGPAKVHGAAVGRDKAIQKLKSMSYLHLSPIAALPVRKAICRNFNASLMNYHVVPLTPNARKYAADCEM